jgi:hypothetical protein
VFNPTWFYTGAVYAAAVTLARRAGIAFPKRVALFFYALVLVFMYLPMTQDYVNVAMDFLETMPPWAYSTPKPHPQNQQLNDLALQIVPWAHQVRESWKSLTPPLWNHYSACGYPLLASAQSSALSPLRILGLPLTLGHSMTFEAAMKILLALSFMYLWCRRRYSEMASTAGAAAFGFSTFIITWLHFPLITTACLVPAVFYVVDLLAERRTYPRFVAGAAVWATMLFGGHPETVSHTFFVATLYVGWLVFIERSVSQEDDGRPGTRNFLLSLFGALAIAGLLAAPLLAPFAEAVTKSKRYQELKTTPISAEVPFSDWASAKLLLQPTFYGAMPKETTWGPAHAESISGFAGYLGIAAWFALLAHVLARRAWRSREMFFVLATVLVVGVILSWPGVSELFHVVFRLAANARLRLFLALLTAVQTAAVIDLMQRDRRSVFIGLGAGAGLLLYLVVGTRFPDGPFRETTMLHMLPSVAVLAIAAVMTSIRRQEWAVLFLLTAVVAELWAADRDWNPVVSNDWMYPKTPILRALDDLTAKIPKTEPYRIVAGGPAFFPNVSSVYGYEDVRAHDPMTNGRYVNVLVNVIDYDAANYFATWDEFEKRFLNFLNVRFIMTTWKGEISPRYRLVYDGNDGRIFENPEVLPRFYAIRNVVLEFQDAKFNERMRTMEGWSHTALLENLTIEAEPQQRDDFFKPRPADAPMATTEILQADPTDYRLHIKAPRYTLIASSVPWWPGWKVQRNGARIEPVRVNGGFLGFTVPPGEVDVRVWYDPWTFRFGSIVALATILGLVAFRLRGRPAPAPADAA